LKEDLEKYLRILPNAWKSDFGEFSLLRVVAVYPADPSLTSINNDKDHHALVTLNVNLCKKLTVHPTVSSILEALQQEARGQKRSADMDIDDLAASESKARKGDRVLRSPSRIPDG
jgi:hypothetical protein